MVGRVQLLLNKISKKKSQISLGLFCLLVIFLSILFRVPGISPFIEEVDNQIYDHTIRLGWHSHPVNTRVVIIDIDEKSIRAQGRWPWPRDIMADLLTKLKQAGVVTMGLDMVLSDPEINYAYGLKNKIKKLFPNLTIEQNTMLQGLDEIAPKVDNDSILAKVLSDQSVVLGFLFHNDSTIQSGSLPTPLINEKGQVISSEGLSLYNFPGYNGIVNLFMQAAKQGGFVTNLPDQDGTVRHSFLLATTNNNHVYPSLALAVAMNYLLTDKIALKTDKGNLVGIELAGLYIPTNKFAQVWVPFWGSEGTLDYFSATDILEKKVEPKLLQGSIAIVGSSMILLSDRHDTPVGQSFPGVEMVGNLVQGIIDQQWITQYDWHSVQASLLLLVLGVTFACVFPFLGVITRGLIFFLSVTAIIIVTLLLFAYKSLYVPSAALMFLLLLQTMVNYVYSYFYETRQKRQISELFSQYVPPDYVMELIDSADKQNMEGQTLELTIQFIDIRNFTVVCEKLDAVRVKHLLNTFFTPVTEIIFSHRGTIDKYVGDMVMAFWGAPISDPNHIKNAIKASLQIFQKLPEINEIMVGEGLPKVNIGLGLATGKVNVGDMGSKFRRAYTVLGDSVNLASRLQDLTKFYQVNILVNESTRQDQHEFLWRQVDKVTVKGRKGVTTIYQPLCLKEEASLAMKEELKVYEKALEYYYAQDWALAMQEFQALSKQYDTCFLYTLYCKRIESFIKDPPPGSWDGVFIHKNK